MKARATVSALLCAAIVGCSDSPTSIDDFPVERWATNIVRTHACLGDTTWVDIDGPGAEAETFPVKMKAMDQIGHSVLGVEGESYRVRVWSVPDSVLLRDTTITWRAEPIDCPNPNPWVCIPKHLITCP